MDERKELGQAIKMARVSAGESQEEFARRFEVTQQTAGGWEANGKVARRHWPTLKEVYGVDPEEFLSADGDRQSGSIGTVRGSSHAISMFGGKSATASLPGGVILRPMEQTLIEELRIKDPDGVMLRKFLADLLNKSIE